MAPFFPTPIAEATMYRAAKAVLTALAASLAVPACAAEEDTQLWLAATAMVDVPRGQGQAPLVVMADTQYRYFGNASRLGQNQLRASLGFRVNKTTVLSQGYVYTRTSPSPGVITHEHRPFQQAMFRIAGNGKGTTLIGRTRLEERILEGSGDVALRARQWVRMNQPLGGGFVGIGTAEVFVNVNSADWGPRAGFDQFRLFGGIGVPLARGLWIEAGYMNQYVARHQRPDRMNHNISLTLSLIR
ncbi:MAG: DUF2490 domain-containing protein [Novosphingobium sp.]|nr:DUF2490 domain-containing protein [Novosphingobium sp.]